MPDLFSGHPLRWRLVCPLLSFLTLIICAGCTPLRSNPPNPRRALIFVPGYKGSILKNPQTGEIGWLTARQIFFGSRSLSLDDPFAAALRPDGILRGVSILGVLFREDIYGDFSHWLHRTAPPDTTIVDFSYDWRKDLRQAAADLARTVEKLRANAVTEIDIIAHSMGGLVVLHYLRLHQSDTNGSARSSVRKAVLVGTPFLGTAKMLRDFQRGTPTGRNSTLLNAEALSTFQSTFTLLPAPGERFLLDLTGQPIEVELYEPGEWRIRKWGAFRDGEAPGEWERLTEQLKSAKDFHEQLFNSTASQSSAARSRLLVIQGLGIPTETYCYFLPDSRFGLACSEAEIREAAVDITSAPLYMDGDGVVSVRSSTVPDVIRDVFHTEEIRVDGEHLGMLNDAEVRHAIWKFFYPESENIP